MNKYAINSAVCIETESHSSIPRVTLIATRQKLYTVGQKHNKSFVVFNPLCYICNVIRTKTTKAK